MDRSPPSKPPPQQFFQTHRRVYYETGRDDQPPLLPTDRGDAEQGMHRWPACEYQLQQCHHDHAENDPKIGENAVMEHRVIQRPAIEQIKQLAEHDRIDQHDTENHAAVDPFSKKAVNAPAQSRI